jgi:hypothetical protein
VGGISQPFSYPLSILNSYNVGIATQGLSRTNNPLVSRDPRAKVAVDFSVVSILNAQSVLCGVANFRLFRGLDMATGKKIREGLFLISWRNYHHSVPNKEIIENVQQLDKNIFEICKLSSKEVKSTLQLQTFLEVEIVLAKAIKSSHKLESMTILATKEWDEDDRRNETIETQQKMNFIGSKWRSSWTEQLAIGTCHHCNSNYRRNFIKILIDFNPFPADVVRSATIKKNQLLNLWKMKIPSDVVIKCEEKSFEAHTFILASGSPVLAAMFQHDCEENQKKIIEIADIQPNVLRKLLHYFYTGDANLEQDADVAELMVAADKYAVDSLKEECGQHLSHKLTVENAGHYLVLAHTINAAKLRESSLNFMARNAKAICSRRKEWIEITKSYPELCLDIMQLMAVF